MNTNIQGLLITLLVLSVILIFSGMRETKRKLESILDNQAAIILDKNSIGNMLFNLSFFGSKVLIFLLAIYKKELYKSILVIDLIKDCLKHTTEEDYVSFLFIRVLYDSLEFENDHFIETLEVVIDDLVSDLKLGRL